MKYTWDSETEEGRLNIEQDMTETGYAIFPNQIWRDGELIPESPKKAFGTTPSSPENDYFSKVYNASLEYGTLTIPVLKYCLDVPLSRVSGTLNVFTHHELKDALDEKFGEEYEIELSLNGTKLSYGVGDPILDSSAGYITFRDENFVNELTKADLIKAKFYKYIGRKGFFGSKDDEIGISYPFFDDKPLLKSSTDEGAFARFIISGGKGINSYILPPTNGKYYKMSEEEFNNNMHVIMTQENMNSIIDTIGIIDGGVWRERQTN